MNQWKKPRSRHTNTETNWCLLVGEEKAEGQCTVGDKKRIGMGLYEIMYVKLLKAVKHCSMRK